MFTRLLQRVFPRILPATLPPLNFAEVAIARRRSLAKDFVERYGRNVQAGPFKGMELAALSSWGAADELPKALGQYEAELHEPLIKLSRTVNFDVVVDIGCADGYYAVGLAILFPQAGVYAYDTDKRAQAACSEALANNNLKNRAVVGGFCDCRELERVLQAAGSPLLFCDCEGGELSLVDLQLVPALRKSWMIIECHDCIFPGTTALLSQRLSTSHRITVIPEGARNPNLHEFQLGLWSLDRWLTVCEFRPEIMNWLFCEPISQEREAAL